MFTGIITDIGTVRSVEQKGDLRLTIACSYDLDTVDLGAETVDPGAQAGVHAVDLGAEAGVDAVDLMGQLFVQRPNLTAQALQFWRDEILERPFDLVVDAHPHHSISP